MSKEDILNIIYDELILGNYKDSSKEFKNDLNKLSEREGVLSNKLMELLDEEGKALFLNYESIVCEQKCLELREIFNKGFEMHSILIK